MGEALLHERMQMRYVMQIGTVATRVAPARIVGPDEDDIGCGLSSMQCRHRREQQDTKDPQDGLHRATLLTRKIW
jgi:hypothetical protein